MDDPVLLCEHIDEITSIVMNRPEQRNAISLAGWRALTQAIADASADPACRVIVIRGASGNFGAGADIAEFDACFASSESTKAYFSQIEQTMASIESTPKPIIAAIEGLCIGACVALALACDIRIASQNSQFAITPAKLGLAYPYGDLGRVTRAIGPGYTRSLLFTGCRIGSDVALAIGLIEHVYKDEEFSTRLLAIARDVAASSRFTIKATKEAVRALAMGLSDELAGYPDVLIKAVSSEDFAEG